MNWRQHTRLFAVIGVVLLVNVGFFLTYRVRYQQRVDDLNKRQSAAEASLLAARNERLAAERQLAAYHGVESAIERVYNESWSTPEQRLTPLILELRGLAKKSELEPTAISYSRQEGESQGPATEMTITFGVSGRYEQVRRLINLLEISRQFVVIDQITLGDRSGEGGSDIALRISLRTLFRRDAAEVENKNS